MLVKKFRNPDHDSRDSQVVSVRVQSGNRNHTGYLKRENLIWRTVNYQQMVLELLDNHIQKKKKPKNFDSHLIPHTNIKDKMDHRPKYKT